MTAGSFDHTVSVANLVAMLAVFVSVSTLLVSIRKNRQLKKTQYADRIRSAAAVLTAKLERWRDLAHGLFEEIQPAITDADVALMKERDVVATRDKFWRDLGVARLAVSQRIRDEQIEIAYAKLYGYDPGVRDLFLTAIDRLQAIRETTHQKVSTLTQNDILRFHGAHTASAELGNKLRTTCAQVAANYAHEMAKVVEPFRQEMIKLIEATDDNITRKKVVLAKAKMLFSAPLENLFASDILAGGEPRVLSGAHNLLLLCCHDGLERNCKPMGDFWTRTGGDVQHGSKTTGLDLCEPHIKSAQSNFRNVVDAEFVDTEGAGRSPERDS